MDAFRIAVSAATVLLLGTHLAVAEPQHAIAMHGTPKEPAGFANFAYAEPSAAKGGRITLGVSGSFDSLNPMIVRGESAAGIREFVFESLLTRGADEPFTLYGLLAESLDTPEDRSAVTFNLNPKARFSDGKPVTADDVMFSIEVLREKGRPNHRTSYKKVVKTERLSDTSVRFVFADGSDRELPLILGLMPVLPRHAFSSDTFEKTTLVPLIGSGPYTIAKVDAGRSIVYARNPDYWGKDLAVNRGRFNFDEIRYDYYRDGASQFEAFKTGAIDIRSEDDPGRWGEGYNFPAAAQGLIVRTEFATGLPAGMNALVFNTRRDTFKSPLVRQAFITLFNFEWANASLFQGLYARTQSFFERSMLSSSGKPADARETELLAPYAAAVKPEIMAGTHRFPVSDGTAHNRENARKAFALLKAAGYELRDGRMTEVATGKPLAFEILAALSSQERLLANFVADLGKLGIAVNLRIVDSAQYQSRLKDYDFDMIQWSWPASLSPGNEQLFRWSSPTAATPGSFNYAGVADPAVDAMIAAMLAAKEPDAFVSAVRALDRVLLSGDYAIPLFFGPKQWIAHWKRLRHPDAQPLTGFNLDTWWIADDK